MEVSSTMFNQPFLVLPELWHFTVPHMSYSELVNVYLIAKFDDLKIAQDNFNAAQRIWCKKISSVTFFDTVYHAYIRKAENAFTSLIKARNDSGEERKNVNRFKNELLNSIDSVLEEPDLEKPDNLEKIVIIAAKMVYVEVFEKLQKTSVFDQIIKSILFKASNNFYNDSKNKKEDVIKLNNEIISNVLANVTSHRNYHIYWNNCYMFRETLSYQDPLKQILPLLPINS